MFGRVVCRFQLALRSKFVLQPENMSKIGLTAEELSTKYLFQPA